MVRREASVLSRLPLRSIALLAALLATMLLAAPLLPEPGSPLEFRISAYLSHAAWFLALLVLVAALAHAWQTPTRRLLTAVGLLAVLVVALNVLAVPVASDLAKIGFGALAGLAFVRALERPWWLLPIVVFVPIADAWSVFSERGVTNAVVERAREEPAWIEWPTLATPIAGLPYELYGRIGIVDVLFAALFLGAAARWRMGVRRGVLALTAGFLATSVLVFEGPGVAVPALPLLCLSFLLAHAPALWRDARRAHAGQ